jgi:alpha-acetolactate decarboxylase
MQGLARDPELGRHHDLGLATLDRQHGTVALLNNRQLDQSQSRPPITVHIGRR